MSQLVGPQAALHTVMTEMVDEIGGLKASAPDRVLEPRIAVFRDGSHRMNVLFDPDWPVDEMDAKVSQVVDRAGAEEIVMGREVTMRRARMAGESLAVVDNDPGVDGVVALYLGPDGSAFVVTHSFAVGADGLTWSPGATNALSPGSPIQPSEWPLTSSGLKTHSLFRSAPQRYADHLAKLVLEQPSLGSGQCHVELTRPIDDDELAGSLFDAVARSLADDAEMVEAISEHIVTSLDPDNKATWMFVYSTDGAALQQVPGDSAAEVEDRKTEARMQLWGDPGVLSLVFAKPRYQSGSGFSCVPFSSR